MEDCSLFRKFKYKERKVMRTKEEIEQLLSNINLDIEYANDWASKAYEKYKVDRDYYGLDADDSEWRAACDAHKALMEKANTLNWVLNK